MSHRTFEDLTVGETIDCGTTTVTREDIVSFGGEFDPLDIHTDPEAAADSPFGGLIASGIHTFALTQPLVVEAFYDDSDLVAARHIDDVRLPAPVRPGDTLHVELEILGTDVTEGGKGLVTTRRTATVDGDTVFDMRNETVWSR
ncbi:MaoC family dehydratase N-terminal domain-containing protein [Natronomonas halophila]|uniref:MaoC/PaaZ C-terminal domain-containing protein n=1 Tax=Natronomonas halophila TaxID=2747817 RepID=UPI0015B6E7A5|nr:MaoC/PaaZ C-terminal domain-containing protein [Natronomonas halophila]QLD87202.1 MaoC family dehydratase N-terminal domain-containing protein [Natronomonas halophila]